MSNKRREFFRQLGSKTAGIAAASVAPTLVQLASLTDDLRTLADQVNRQLAQQTVEFGNQLQHLGDRMDQAMATAAWQQTQLLIIFFLLLLSFAIDAGLTFSVASLAI